VFPQLPGWVLTKDRDGNLYYIDMRGKIWTSGAPEYIYKAISSSGIDYYLNHGLQLIKNHHIPEGINILHSILALTPTNQQIYTAQSAASNEVQRLKKREGPRYQRHVEKFPILLYRMDNTVFIQNQIIPYVVKLSASPTILNSSQRKKHGYEYHGLSVGLSFDGIPSKKMGTFDALLSIDSERFKSAISSIDEIVVHWNIVLGNDVFKRKLLEKGTNKLINEIRHEGSPPFSGYEGFFINRNSGHIIKIIFSSTISDIQKEKLLEIIKGVKV
jgi:hypothetical protein